MTRFLEQETASPSSKRPLFEFAGEELIHVFRQMKFYRGRVS